MELAKVTSKGQITIPLEIRKKMQLKTGDKILFFEENGRCFFQNSNDIVLLQFQKAMKGEAKKAGFADPDDVAKYLNQLRKKKR